MQTKEEFINEMKRDYQKMTFSDLQGCCEAFAMINDCDEEELINAIVN